jgi:hypothetical protein
LISWICPCWWYIIWIFYRLQDILHWGLFMPKFVERGSITIISSLMKRIGAPCTLYHHIQFLFCLILVVLVNKYYVVT